MLPPFLEISDFFRQQKSQQIGSFAWIRHLLLKLFLFPEYYFNILFYPTTIMETMQVVVYCGCHINHLLSNMQAYFGTADHILLHFTKLHVQSHIVTQMKPKVNFPDAQLLVAFMDNVPHSLNINTFNQHVQHILINQIHIFQNIQFMCFYHISCFCDLTLTN